VNRFELGSLAVPVVQAPLAGGPSTVALSAGVVRAGGLGFVAAGYRTAGSVRDDIRALQAAVDGPFGVNLFVPPSRAADSDAVAAYVETLAGDARRHAVALGAPRVDDDEWLEKLDIVCGEHVPVVSFVFGLPSRDVIERVGDSGAAVWVTVTGVEEAQEAAAAGADAIVVQGAEAGGHRASFLDDGDDPLTLLSVLQLVGDAVALPMIAAGGIATGAALAAVLCAGAEAAQLGTALMRTPEAGTAEVHRRALASGTATRLTRAFTGKRARAIVNRFVEEHSADAPEAYPQLHHVTAPLRAAGRESGDADVVNLWAGETHALSRELPVEELIGRLVADARAAVSRTGDRLGSGAVHVD
jgi:nitronate monooxygenase